ncbi:MAG TPA: hypothetical protein VGH59_16480 [Casimicrobiaceae bacterium]|jgi:hypothetical protein
MEISGQCHCGNIALLLDIGADPPEIAARACGCSFCVKHGGVWTSNPKYRLQISVGDRALVSEYEFGTRTATFHVCARCGAVPLVTSDIAGRLYAVVNVNALEHVNEAWLRRATASFEGEDVESRLSRRARNWIAQVRIVDAAA